MANKYIIQRRTASGLETVAEIPALESGKVDLSWLPVVGSMGSAIIERGDNANGEYIRWADGTQICIISKDLSITCTIISEPINYASLGTFVYPAEFSSRPAIFGAMTEQANSDARGYVTFGDVASDAFLSMTPHVHYYRVRETTNVPAHLDILAIGRWK